MTAPLICPSILASDFSRLGEEVLAVSVEQGAPPADMAPHDDAELGLRFWLRAAGT